MQFLFHCYSTPVLLKKDNPHDPSCFPFQYRTIPISVIAFLSAKQLCHASKGLVITRETESYPVLVDAFYMHNCKFIHYLHHLQTGVSRTSSHAHSCLPHL